MVCNDKSEIKQRMGTCGQGCLNANLWGCFDDFVKWDFDSNSGDPLLSMVLDGEYQNWISIE